MTVTNERKLKDNIQKNLIFYRKKAKLTQKDVAERAGAGATTVSGWERGAYTPDVDTLLLVCNILNVSFAEMCGLDSAESSFPISADEKLLVTNYRKLNEDGRAELMKRSDELITLGYTASNKKGDERFA